MQSRTRVVRSMALVAAGVACVVPVVLVASGVSIPHAFSNAAVANANQVNANFTAVEAAIDDNDARLTRIETTSTASKVKYHRLFTPALIEALATNKDGTQALTNGRYDLTVSLAGQRMFDLALVPAGTLLATKTYTLRVEALVEQITTDSDPTIVVSDGSDIVGFQYNDAANGVIGHGIQGADAAKPAMASVGIGGGAMPTNSIFTEILLHLAPTSTHLLVRRGSDAAPAYGTASRIVNVDQALKLSLIGNNLAESYGIYGLTVTITEDGP